jgi:hypothetical protein
MIVGALVRPADDLNGHLAVLEHLFVADRRLEQMPVLVDPVLEVEGVEPRHDLSPRSFKPLKSARARRRACGDWSAGHRAARAPTSQRPI